MEDIAPVPQGESADRRARQTHFAEFVALFLCAALLVVFRLHAFDLPLETDECNYAYIGERLLAGDQLYVDVWDHQPFGVFVLFAGVQSLFGNAPIVFRWMCVVFSLASLWLIFAFARRCGGTVSAIGAAAMFAVVSSDPGTAGEGCNREIYMNTLILAAWFMVARREVGSRGWLFGAGAAMALGSALKTIVAVHWCFLAIWLGFRAFRSKADGSSGRAAALDIMAFGIPPALMWSGALLYFAATERFAEFIDAVFLFNLGYSGASSGFFGRFAGFFAPERHPFIFDSAWPLWLASVPATLWLAFASFRRRDPLISLIVIYVISSYIAVCLPGKSWPHYYYLLIPPALLAVAKATADCVRGLRRRLPLTKYATRGVLGAVCVAIPVWLLISEYRSYFSRSLFDITVQRYNSRDFWGRGQGRNVKKVTDPTDEIFVFGNDASIYYYAERRCASRYTMITGLGAGYSGVERRRKILLEELERRLPRVILLLFDEEPFEEWRTFLQRYYTDPVGVDFNDRTGKPIMFVVARKDDPIDSIDWDWDRSFVTGVESRVEE